jgi:hypothetical protein
MITREQIRRTLDEIYDTEYGDGEGELTLADGITFWLQNGEYPFDVVETIIDAVYELSGKPRSAWLVCSTAAGRVELHRRSRFRACGCGKWALSDDAPS